MKGEKSLYFFSLWSETSKKEAKRSEKKNTEVKRRKKKILWIEKKRKHLCNFFA